MFCFQVGNSLETECAQLSTYSPVLLVQGALGGVVASVKVASEGKLIEAGSSIVEGLDRVFKLVWIMNMSYPLRCFNIFKFLEHCVFRINDGQKVPPTVVELTRYLKK